ncbi:MAG: hypothetical protein V1870_03400 [Candidatus Aenigmatarchaeota archaeon]
MAKRSRKLVHRKIAKKIPLVKSIPAQYKSEKTSSHSAKKIFSQSAKIPGDMAALKIAGALYIMLGLISIFSGFLMVYLSYFSVGFITAFSSVLMQGDIAIFMIGVTSVSLGIIEFLVGYGLWKLHKWAGMLGFVMAVFSLLLSIPYFILNSFSGAMSAGFAIVLLVLIYFGRKNLFGDWL